MVMPSLKIGHLECRLPIVQGGMGGGVSLSGLASAVIACGGLGVLTSVGIGLNETDFSNHRGLADIRALRKEIIKVKQTANGPLGVNVMMAITSSDKVIETAIEAGADILFLGAGLPLGIPECAQKASKEGRIALAPIVSSAKAFELISRAWSKRYGIVPDAVVVEGPKAGGHLGFDLTQIDDPAYALEMLVPQVLAAVKKVEAESGKKIPLIAGGGVYTGADIKAMIDLGASGVQMATRFVATTECDASQQFKDAYIAATKDDISLISSPLGLPGRAIRNNFFNEVEKGNKMISHCDWQCLKSCKMEKAAYCIGEALVNAQRGQLDDGFAFAGSNVYRIDRIMPVAELMQELTDEYNVA